MYSSYADKVSQYLGEYSDGCGTYHKYSDPEELKYNSYQVGIQLSHYTIRSKYKSIMFRGSAFYGYDRVKNLNTDDIYSENTFAVSPYLQFDWRPVGFGFGFLLGRFRFADLNRSTQNLDRGDWENAPNEYLFYPQLYFRAGPIDIAFAEINLANFVPSSSPMPLWRLGLGTGIGKVDGTRLVTGICDAGWYLETSVPLREKFMFTGFASTNFQSGMDGRYILSFGFKYRFNFQTVPKKSTEKNQQQGY